MTVLMMKEFDRLKKTIFSLAALVEESVNRSVRSAVDRDRTLAEKVIEGDREIDQMEVEVEEECLKILALHQPVAGDLRYIVAVLKLNNDLERMGDLAVGISRNTLKLHGLTYTEMPFDIQPMSEMAREMLKKSLDALVNLDIELAREVLATDKKVDAMHHEMYDAATKRTYESPDDIESMLRVLGIARNLERIADHATNVAEDVVYLVQGEIIRHNLQDGARREKPPASLS